MIISDHGAGPLHGVVNLNAWLAQEGFLAYATGGGVKRRELLGKALELRRHLPERWRYAAKQRLPKLRDRAQERSDYSVLDWPQTRAFAYGTFGNIVINVRGREAQGVVEPGEEYERVRDEIAARIADLRGPGGQQIVADVHRREDLFQGPQLDKVPDLLVEFDRYAWLGKGNLKTRSDSLWDRIEIEDSEHSYVGSHRHEGIAVLAGPAAAEGATLAGELVDVAPTLLYLLGEPIPSDLEGRVLFEALRPELLDERPPQYDDAVPAEFDSARTELEDEGAAEVERRLRGLGYLE
jgi:predicted AlkP superfamily phosphohydrolase/phosphomutase